MHIQNLFVELHGPFGYACLILVVGGFVLLFQRIWKNHVEIKKALMEVRKLSEETRPPRPDEWGFWRRSFMFFTLIVLISLILGVAASKGFNLLALILLSAEISIKLLFNG